MGRAAVAWVAAAGLAVTAGRPGAAQDSAPAQPAPAPVATDSAAPAVPGLDTITAADIEAHVRTLAADDMKGRDARSGGIELAAAYVRERMAAMGLTPAGTDGTWFHAFATGRIERDGEATRLATADVTLAMADGWLTIAPCDGTWTGRLVFAGDGSDDAWASASKDAGALAGAWLVVRSARSLVARDTADALATAPARSAPPA